MLALSWKLLFGVIVASALLAIGLTLTDLPTIVRSALLGYLTPEHLSKISDQILTSLIVLLIIAILTYQFRAVRRLLRLSLERTDEQIVGDWYIYRAGKKNGNLKLLGLDEKWRIRRTFAGVYNVRIVMSDKGNEITGTVMYKERDRLNILLTGVNHKQQSLVSFQLSIPSSTTDASHSEDTLVDSRMLGIGVGDDSDYVLTARVYLASKSRLPKDHVETLLDAATKQLRSNEGRLLQLSSTEITRIFKDSPMPFEAQTNH
jgi:hypothetical protein